MIVISLDNYNYDYDCLSSYSPFSCKFGSNLFLFLLSFFLPCSSLSLFVSRSELKFDSDISMRRQRLLDCSISINGTCGLGFDSRLRGIC